MKRLVWLAVTLGVLALTSDGQGGPVTKQALRKFTLGGMKGATLSVEFKGGERASAIVKCIKGASHVGLYVYDKYGNCVALDDNANMENGTHWAVDWHPQETDAYTIEVRNFSQAGCECFLLLR